MKQKLFENVGGNQFRLVKEIGEENIYGNYRIFWSYKDDPKHPIESSDVGILDIKIISDTRFELKLDDKGTVIQLDIGNSRAVMSGENYEGKNLIYDLWFSRDQVNKLADVLTDVMFKRSRKKVKIDPRNIPTK